MGCCKAKPLKAIHFSLRRAPNRIKSAALAFKANAHYFKRSDTRSSHGGLAGSPSDNNSCAAAGTRYDVIMMTPSSKVDAATGANNLSLASYLG